MDMERRSAIDDERTSEERGAERLALEWYASAVMVLDASMLYLQSFDDLYWELQDAVERLGEQYRSETTPEGKDRLGAKIRRAVRRIEGKVSESFAPVLNESARHIFVDEWAKLSIEDRKETARNCAFAKLSGRPLSASFKMFARPIVERLVSKTLGVSIGPFEEGFGEAVANDLELAFALSEYVSALDDYADAEAADVVCFADAFKRELRRVFADPVEDGGKLEPRPIEPEETSPNAEEKNESKRAEKPDGYYLIDELAAENAKRAISFDRYVPNSATRAYRADVDAARALAAGRKERVDSRCFDRIDRLLESYERRLADWTNRRNLAEASCPSVLIAGAGNFPTKKHERKLERLDALYKERESIREILSKLDGVGSGGISSDDVDAIEKLQNKLERLKEAHEEMKRANAYLKKNGSWDDYDRPEWVKDAYDGKGEPTYFYLSASLAEIRRVEKRLETLRRTADADYGDGWRFQGGIAKVNKEENRLQIFFDEIPDEETRSKLKGRGFRWSPRNKAWQRMLTPDAMWTAKFLGYVPKDWKPKIIEKTSEQD